MAIFYENKDKMNEIVMFCKKRGVAIKYQE